MVRIPEATKMLGQSEYRLHFEGGYADYCMGLPIQDTRQAYLEGYRDAEDDNADCYLLNR